MDHDACKPEVDLLTQQEIERLLARVTAETSRGVVRRTDGTREIQPLNELRAHDFRAPSVLAAGPWRQFQAEHEDWARSLGMRLSTFLRLDLDLKLSGLETRSCHEFLQGVAEPAHLALFKVAPWRGLCVCEIEPHLALSFVDRLMGGTGRASSVNRDLSEIETALLDQVLDLILGHWCRHWAKVQDLRPEILGHENSARYAQIASPEALFLVLAVEVRIGDCLEEFKLAFPCAAMEPLLKNLNATSAREPKETTPPRAAPKWNPAFAGVKVALAAEWPAQEVSTRQIASLRVGDVLQWHPTASTAVKLRLAEHPKFVGRLGTCQGKWAVEITEQCAPQAT